MTIFVGLIIGVVSGAVAALCGVGGGIIMVPAFTSFLNMEQKPAVATSLAAIVLMAMAGTAKNQANGFIDWKIVIPTAVAGAIVAWFAADLLKQFSNENLTRGFAILMICVGVKMLFEK